jgi:N-carbamoylputrescine amidase
MKVVRSEMSPTLVVAAISLMSKMADPKSNLEKAAEVIAKAVKSGAEIVVFPETYITGYTCGEVEGKFFDLAEPIPGPSTEVLVKQAKKYNVYIASGLVEANQDYPGLIHNSAVFLGPEGILHVHRKVHLPNFPPFKEISYGFTPGDKFTVFKIKQNWNIGMLICYDASFPEPARLMVINGADLLITLSAGPNETEKAWTLINQMRARENTVFYLFSNVVGTQWGDITFFGGPAIVAPDGEFLMRGKVGEEDLIVARLEATALFERRKVYPVLRDRRSAAYKGIV